MHAKRETQTLAPGRRDHQNGHERATSVAAGDLAPRKPPQSEQNRGWQRTDEIIVTLAQYRRATMALLRRYAKLSVQHGRLPSVVGQDFFRARASSRLGNSQPKRESGGER